MISASRCRAASLQFLAAVLLRRAHAVAGEVPRGHLEPFGGWRAGVPIEERADVPEPQEFDEKYCRSDRGNGRPVVFRGAASNMLAVERWATDDLILESHGHEKVTGVEFNLKETRAGGHVEGMDTMGKFLKAYNTSDIYMVSSVPRGMMAEVDFLPSVRCGGYLNFLDTHNMWFGRGGSKSVVHYDDQDNINCMIAGRKRFIFMHPSYKARFEAFPNSDRNEFGWVDADLDEGVAGYGGFMGKLDVDRVDLLRFPGWRDVEWSYVDLAPGDCVYIPFQWYHQVTAAAGRSINVHTWYWRPETFDARSCAEPVAAPTLADCTWGYEPPEGHHGVKRRGGKPPTACGRRGEGPRRRRRKQLSQEL